MVRDDFWLAVSRFMRELEVRIVEADNSALVDLFDPLHARKVLSDFGQAFGRLPENPNEFSSDQQSFLDAAVTGLAHDGKIISVRLALFAEMVKGKPWTPATLQAVGGTEGVGATFLEETFSAGTAPPEHRLHQKAARNVLRALLPESGTDIKGHMRSHTELLVASGYANRPKDFADLLRILDQEVRLITPTDPEGQDDEDAEPTATGGQFYQLTHDYLVPSLRDWLTRKQKETRRGRAELRLAELAAGWSSKPLKRNLPTWWEHINIRILTKKLFWSPSQQRMMRTSANYHGLRWTSSLVILTIIVVSFTRYLAVRQQENDVQRADTLVKNVLAAPPQAVPYAIENLKPLEKHAVIILNRFLKERTLNHNQRLHAACALAEFGHTNVDEILSLIGNTTLDEITNIANVLKGARKPALDRLKIQIRTAEDEENWAQKSRYAVVALLLGEKNAASEMCAMQTDPIQRTTFINLLPKMHPDLTLLEKVTRNCNDGPLQSALCFGLGDISAEQMSVKEKELWIERLTNWYKNSNDTGTHSASYWAMRQWKSAPEVNTRLQVERDPNWQVNSVGMTLLRLQSGQFLMGSQNGNQNEKPVHEEKIGHTFYISAQEVSVRQFGRFLDDMSPNVAKPEDWHGYSSHTSPTEFHPIQNVSINDAILFCNWLSDREQRGNCYLASNGRWSLAKNVGGYRLPSEAEWEYACRAGTQTEYFFGENSSLISDYAVCGTLNTQPCGTAKPNVWGLYDMHGNVHELCSNASNDPLFFNYRLVWYSRGGGWRSTYADCRSASRYQVSHGERSIDVGFRVVLEMSPTDTF